MSRRSSRRVFLRNGLLGGAGLIVLHNSRSVWSYEANEKVNVAIVGVSGRGSWFSATMPNLANVVAMCEEAIRLSERASV